MSEFFGAFFAVVFAGAVITFFGFLLFKFMEFMFEASDGATWGVLVFLGVLILIFATMAGIIASGVS